MTTIFEKIRTVVLSRAHGLLNAVIDFDNIGAIKQHVRDLESSIGQSSEATAQAIGYRRTEEDNLIRIQAEVDEKTANISAILADDDPSNDNLSVPIEASLIVKEQEKEQLQELFNEAMKTEQDLRSVLTHLKNKHALMLSQLGRLESIDRATKAKNRAAKILKKINVSSIVAGEKSVDNIEAKILKNKNVANARFELAMGDMNKINNDEKSILFIKAAQRIAEKKKALQTKG